MQCPKCGRGNILRDITHGNDTWSCFECHVTWTEWQQAQIAELQRIIAEQDKSIQHWISEARSKREQVDRDGIFIFDLQAKLEATKLRWHHNKPIVGKAYWIKYHKWGIPYVQHMAVMSNEVTGLGNKLSDIYLAGPIPEPEE